MTVQHLTPYTDLLASHSPLSKFRVNNASYFVLLIVILLLLLLYTR